jgi:hypothetical protein
LVLCFFKEAFCYIENGLATALQKGNLNSKQKEKSFVTSFYKLFFEKVPKTIKNQPFPPKMKVVDNHSKTLFAKFGASKMLF